MKLPTKAEGGVVASGKKHKRSGSFSQSRNTLHSMSTLTKTSLPCFFFRGEGGLLETCCLAHFCFACALFLFVQKRKTNALLG